MINEKFPTIRISKAAYDLAKEIREKHGVTLIHFFEEAAKNEAKKYQKKKKI